MWRRSGTCLKCTVTRVPQPVAHGTPYQKTIVYQIHNLAAALPLIAEDDTIVLKSRPDFVAECRLPARQDREFRPRLRDRNRSRAVRRCKCRSRSSRARSGRPGRIQTSRSSTKMLRSWAGRTILSKLTMPVKRADLDMLGVEPCYHYYHIVRFAKTVPASPIRMFKGYLENYRYITNNMPYRSKLIPHFVKKRRIFHFSVDRARLDSSQPLSRRYGRAGRPSVLSQHEKQDDGLVEARGLEPRVPV